MLVQQSDLYRAEEEALAELPQELRKKWSEQEAQARVDEWRDLPWWGERFPMVRRIEVYERNHGKAGSCGGFFPEASAGVIDMAPQHMNPLFVCHETAHVLSEARFNSQAHDPWFARTYLHLVYLTMGSEAYISLYKAFERHGIDHRIDE